MEEKEVLLTQEGYEKLEKDPDNQHLQKQVTVLKMIYLKNLTTLLFTYVLMLKKQLSN